MNITKTNDIGIFSEPAPKPTEEELQSEFHFALANMLTDKLLQQGLITQEEREKIMLKNVEKFPTLTRKIIG